MKEQLKDIKGVIYILDWGTLLFLLLLTMTLIGLGYLLFKLLRQWSARGKRAKKEMPVSSRPFNEIAIEALSKIDPVEYFETGRIKEYYFEITEVVRQFLASNYHIDTMDKTSYEIIEMMERVESDWTKVKELNHYFNECDLVKFAKLRPELAEMKEKKLQSERIIREYLRSHNDLLAHTGERNR